MVVVVVCVCVCGGVNLGLTYDYGQNIHHYYKNQCNLFISLFLKPRRCKENDVFNN